MNSDQSEIWCSAINEPNLMSVCQYTSSLNISLQLLYINHLNEELPDNTAKNFKWILIDQKFDSVQYIHQIY